MHTNNSGKGSTGCLFRIYCWIPWNRRGVQDTPKWSIGGQFSAQILIVESTHEIPQIRSYLHYNVKGAICHPASTGTKLAKLLYSVIVTDIRKEIDPSTKDYTHYSHVHATYSRIDHLFISPHLINPISSAEIWDVAWTDCNNDYHKTSKCISMKHAHQWRLNKSLLSDPVICCEI